KMRQAEVQLRALEREAEARRTVLQEFMQRAQETGKQGGLQRPDAEVISAAFPPTRADWPNVLLVLAFGGIAGLVLGTTAAFLRGAPGIARAPAEHRPSAQPPGLGIVHSREMPKRRLVGDKGHERV